MFGLLKSGLNKIRKAFSRTRSALGDRIRDLFRSPLDEETLEELEQIVGAGQPGIGVTRNGIDFQPLHQVSCTIGTDGKISLYGRVSTMAEMHNILLNYHTLNPEGKLQIMYWESSLADSVIGSIRELAEGIGIKAITDSKLRTY